MTLYRPSFLFAFFLFAAAAIGGQTVYGNSKTGICKIPTGIILVADTVPLKCAKTPEIEKIIDDAISLGAPIYNEGLHMACYRIYEWAGYKILYEYGKTCKEVEKILKAAIEKSHGDYSDTEKAWLMRAAFDKILGVPTRTSEPEREKDSSPRKG